MRSRFDTVDTIAKFDDIEVDLHDAFFAPEGFDEESIKELIDMDFFNALFVIPRIVGFTAHYLDQKRLDEGLFRLPDEDVLLS